MKEKVIKQFLDFERKMLSNPKTFFLAFEHGNKGRSNIIWNEYLDWQNEGGKQKDLDIRIIGDNKDILTWKIGDEGFAQQVDKFAPFSIEQYKQGLRAVYSFMSDRPQYFKFRKMEGMFNPLRLLLYKFL